jgi:excisionase family DNA binding protein
MVSFCSFEVASQQQRGRTDMARSSASTDSHTYLAADSDEELYRAFADALKAVPEATKHRPALVAADGTEVPLPRELHDALLQVALALQAGMGVNVAPLNATLTTQECADYLGVSRPTIVRLLDSGEIPMSRPGRHRYVRLVDLIAYAEQVRRTRADALDELARDAEAKGLYEILDGPPPAMR